MVKLKRACSVREPCSYEIGPLAPVPYEVQLLTYASNGKLASDRRAFATP
jgi:hypothetical protein